MNKQFAVLILCLAICSTGFARVKHRKPQTPVFTSRFQSNLNNILRVSKKPSGFDSLKQSELSNGVWNCRIELDGFLPVVEENAFHPARRLEVSAVSVTPAAFKHARMLVLKGIPGYTMRDSDNDKTVAYDKQKESRRVVFKRVEKFCESTVTLIYNAHQYGSVEMLIEAW
jgi:hypothetical protein